MPLVFCVATDVTVVAAELNVRCFDQNCKKVLL